MNATVTPIGTSISARDRAVLAAVAAGRAEVRAGTLLIDGRYCADQFALARLAAAGLLATEVPGSTQLTPSGDHALRAA